MKYIYFYRQDNDFTDILKDPSVKPYVYTKIIWYQFLLLGIHEDKKEDSIISYINIKYGDDIRNNIHPDFSPIPNKDYMIKK